MTLRSPRLHFRTAPARHHACLLLLLASTGTLAAQGPPPPPGPLQPPPAPAGNPLTAEKALLGKALFWDEQLSSTRTVACGTCHIPAAGASDPRTAASPLALHPGADGQFETPDDVLGSPGVPQSVAGGTYLDHADFGILEQATGRRSRPASEAGYAPNLFWDGRAGDALVDPETLAVVLAAGAALESQALAPILNSTEMAHVGRQWGDVIARLATAEPLALALELPAGLDQELGGRTYPGLFSAAFGSSEITATRIAMAIASYERTLVSNQTPLDIALSGGAPLTPLEQQGRGLFVASNCAVCHAGALLSNDAFHYTGVRPVQEDLGRFAETGNNVDRGAMRTPTLRNLTLRAPYMHNGELATLADVVDFYDRGGDFDAPNKNPLIVPLNLSPQQKTALLAFLGRPLTDPRVAAETAPFDRPQLYTESDRVPFVEGVGIAGGSGLEPQVVALEPPFAGSPGCTVGVWGTLGGATAILAIDDSDPGLSPPPSAALAREELTLAGTGATGGWGSVSLPIPADIDLYGSSWFGRWYIADPGAVGGFAVSGLLRWAIFPGRRAPATAVFVDDFETGNSLAWSGIQP
ncbi:MAG: cytochrome c peroxidase [Thermoanaerobaculia bacterium]